MKYMYVRLVTYHVSEYAKYILVKLLGTVLKNRAESKCH